MFFRLVTGIRMHFEARFVEWASAAALLYWGLKLVGPGDAWTNKAAWAGMLYWLPENDWGLLCVLIGGLRLFALAVNGTFATTAYSRYSPHVRGVTAILSASVWLMVFLSVNATSVAGGGIYPLPLVLDVWCVAHAWRDTGRAKAARNGVA